MAMKPVEMFVENRGFSQLKRLRASVAPFLAPKSLYVHYPTRPLDPNMEPDVACKRMGSQLTPTQIFGSVSGRLDILPERNTLFFGSVRRNRRYPTEETNFG